MATSSASDDHRSMANGAHYKGAFDEAAPPRGDLADLDTILYARHDKDVINRYTVIQEARPL
ncbi:hypothetical protein [Myceligenerans pegani]|uniref:Uncharacterized protein n=1 Tax=Myceligenerans pegani TaxID=2776917 RepID=A0ABR9MWA0_9MICO|nr:hypothetical protein [Myceligenerans sp. TRM 65318]MBE1875199.1 hypothetical protein [Myceligenerans sp. TRM 65318]MBE3017470.1 hypothetical protein [Myceligenerans sp. TRM 65318]